MLHGRGLDERPVGQCQCATKPLVLLQQREAISQAPQLLGEQRRLAARLLSHTGVPPVGCGAVVENLSRPVRRSPTFHRSDEVAQRRERILGERGEAHVGHRSCVAVPVCGAELIVRRDIGRAEDRVGHLLDTAVHAVRGDSAVVAVRIGEVVEREALRFSHIDLEGHLVQVRVPPRELLGREVHHGDGEFGSVLAELDFGVELAGHPRGADSHQG